MDYDKIHSLSFENRVSLEKVNKCGCFYCMTIFDPAEIKEWVEDEHGDTAVCPYCGIDSVIPEANEYVLSKTLLEEMNKEFFWEERFYDE